MRKKVFGRHFSRSRKAREALFKSLIKTFLLYGKIETTIARAKSVQGDIDGIVTRAKEGSVAAQRQIAAALSADRKTIEKLMKDAASFKEKTSGFTKITRLPRRFGDAAEMARLEWTEQPESISKQFTSKTVTQSKKETKKEREKPVKETKTKRKKATKKLS